MYSIQIIKEFYGYSSCILDTFVFWCNDRTGNFRQLSLPTIMVQVAPPSMFAKLEGVHKRNNNYAVYVKTTKWCMKIWRHWSDLLVGALLL